MPATPATPTDTPDQSMSAFLPPVNRAMRTLDRSFFAKTVPLAAAHVFDARHITRFQKECAGDVLRLPRTKTIVTDGARKLLLLRPGVRHDDLSTAGEGTREYVRSKRAELLPYTLKMTYSDWSYHDIMSAILPTELMSEIPQSFAQAGHLAHLNLRAHYAPYKHLIAAVILDKNPRIKTVINKLEDVGAESEFRTFPMELLAGDPNTTVEVSESACTFRFDFAKVYWNTRLGDEHARVWGQFAPGQAVCDVMAGVGPFAIPAAKRGVIVWASDLNPHSHASMLANIAANRTAHLVTPFCRDGREFIRNSARELHQLTLHPETATIAIPAPAARSRSKAAAEPQEPRRIPLPPVFSHYVMNLPATAIEFLDAFRGAYRGLEHLFPDGADMPMVHVYCFHKSPEQETAAGEVARRLSGALGCEMDRPDRGVSLVHVRVVSPNKVYYCVSFRLPREVVFAEVLFFCELSCHREGEEVGYAYSLPRVTARDSLAHGYRYSTCTTGTAYPSAGRADTGAEIVGRGVSTPENTPDRGADRCIVGARLGHCVHVAATTKYCGGVLGRKNAIDKPEDEHHQHRTVAVALPPSPSTHLTIHIHHSPEKQNTKTKGAKEGDYLTRHLLLAGGASQPAG